ncbi:hypothetical protein E2320_012131 [Naja naja]|nr:hypothetical protein E2320_012131 [Naja naja]
MAAAGGSLVRRTLPRELFFGYFLSSIFTSGALDFPGTVSCHDDPWRIWLPKEVANLSSWDIDILGQQATPEIQVAVQRYRGSSTPERNLQRRLRHPPG